MAWPARTGLLTVAACLACALALSAGGATRTYSSGPLNIAVAGGVGASHAITVPDTGPVAHVAVEVRLDQPELRQLTLTLAAPSGRRVVLLGARSAAGKNLGRGRGCSGDLARFEDGGAPPGDLDAPFAGETLRPAQRLASLDGEQARGKWTLEAHDGVGGESGVLRCWRLEVARDVVERRTVTFGGVTATLSFREVSDEYSDTRLRIVREGRTVLASTVPGAGAPGWRPVPPPVVRRLDADAEPEVVVEAFTGGAHCCTVSHVYRWSARAARYTRQTRDWGNVGYRVADLDRDGRPEFRSADDRFNYRFTAYALSAAPLQIWRLDRGRLRDVTRLFKASVRADAAAAWRRYRSLRKQRLDVRGALAAWLADQYLLGRGDAGWKQVGAAYRRGELGKTAKKDGYAAGRAYVVELRAFLRKLRYAR
jgi:subtilisin-like proprotein convertase family protein